MGERRRAAISWAVAAGAALTSAAIAPAAPAATVITDPVGDSTAATGDPACNLGCPDINAVHVGEAGGRIVVEVRSAAPWGRRHASVTLSGLSPFGGGVGIRMTSDLFEGPPPYERVLADPNRHVFRLDAGAAFMRHYPLELRVLAAAVSHTAALGAPPVVYDRAPDAGEVVHRLDDRDGDTVPDLGDPCPDQAQADPPPGWSTQTTPVGCAPVVPPFTSDDFVVAAKELERTLRARWSDRRTRRAALRRRFVTLPFQVPAGAAEVRLWVFRRTAPRVLSFTLATRLQACPPGRCPLRARIFPRNVRRLAGKRLVFHVVVIVGGRDRSVNTSYRSTVRMRTA